ncbi:ABC transporter substrate-binding protein [Fimbriimonas ginsengisoli]|uniref:Extracellular solute-binding protein family 1 n=1 Tax=Fimbriimonas ginsengisoli Gsoil 348 TaxID=661478 RepID=A0A068NJP6_FIMGI|nr:sugar ABC transporter substrate-binding protein [Fimbriimonas ginsengisoli]AIE83726.1 extracellular solute-binding protein family 1 [Fimbriimonas ginsengisoli Gsoil 348]
MDTASGLAVQYGWEVEMTIRLLTLAALLLLIGRIAFVASPTSPKSAGVVTVEMSVWGMPFENALYTDVYIPEFERQNPGIKVRFHHFEDYPNRVLLSHAGGIAPDVMREGYETSQAWTRRGLNLPLNRFIDGPDGIDRKDFIPMLWDGLAYKRETYGVPQDINILGLFYNKDLFDKAGLTYPDSTWTWKELKSAIDRLTIDRNGDGHPEQKGLDMGWGGATFRPFLYEAGGRVWNGGRAVFDSPSGIEALKFYRSLMKSYSLTRSTEDRGGLGPDKFFQNGNVAMYIDGSWMTPSISKGAPNLRFGVAPLPKGLKAMSISGSCIWGIDRDTKHPAEAWKLVKFLSSEWALKKYWQTLWVAPPSRWSALRSAEFHDVKGIPGQIPGVPTPEMFKDKCAWIPEVLEHRWTTLEYASPYTDRMMTRLNKAVDEVLLQNRDPAVALHQAAKDTNADIAESKRGDAR